MDTLELLKKYDVPGPRYTSYPTVPIWSETIGIEDYKNSLQRISSQDNISLYFHIPFCENRCHFCGCTRFHTQDKSLSAPYADTLINELNSICSHISSFGPSAPACRVEASSEDGRPIGPSVSQIHFGGGSPNFLKPEELSKIMNKVRELFTILPDAEIAIEMNPKMSSKEFCENLYREGFNRISIGVQDFNDSVQKLINRNQSYDVTKSFIDDLRTIGFKHFNFDLVYGLPGQTIDNFSYTLEKTKELNPNRLAVYSFALVPWAHPEQRSFKNEEVPSPETKVTLFEIAHDFFTKNGFHLIGMDHFAREDDELYQASKNNTIHRNFMGYSTRAEAHQIGVGASSISYVAGNYFQNQKNVCQYQTLIAENSLATCKGFKLSQDDHIRRDFITKLMCDYTVDITNFSKQHAITFKDYFADDLLLLKEFIDDNLIELTPTHLTVTKQGHFVVRNMAMCFDKYLEEIKKTARNPVFSRTV
jgi:oxygen-independent coproporphyrinogen III oxidase